jgi:hypothetical protein
MSKKKKKKSSKIGEPKVPQNPSSNKKGKVRKTVGLL